MKTNQIIIILTLPVIAFMVYLAYLLNSTQRYNDTIEKLENIHTLTQSLLEQQMRHALSLSMFLANDKELVQSYLNDDRQRSFEIVSQKLATQHIAYDVQIHDANLKTYLRSWDKNKTGEALGGFRSGLVQVRNTQKPQASIELGKRLNIKAIAPIFDLKGYAGSVEVILGFENLQEMLNKQNAYLYILLDTKYLDIAVDTVQNPKVGEYVVANFRYNPQFLSVLENSDIQNFDVYGFSLRGEFALSYFTIYDNNAEKLGYMITLIEV